jgi:radical SAM-linked protein
MRGDAGFPVRVAFAKHGKVRFVSHRDVARAFERAFRIVELPIAFTQGFSPRPKVSFGLALSVGHESDAEYLDVELLRPVEAASTAAALDHALPEGITVLAVAPIADRAPALQEAVSAVEWEIEIVAGAEPADVSPEAVIARVEAVMAADTLPIERVRKGRPSSDDIRPALRRLAVLGPSERGTVVTAELATRPVSVRPAELAGALDPGFREGRVRRTRQWIERGVERLDPLDADPRNALEARAS